MALHRRASLQERRRSAPLLSRGSRNGHAVPRRESQTGTVKPFLRPKNAGRYRNIGKYGRAFHEPRFRAWWWRLDRGGEAPQGSGDGLPQRPEHVSVRIRSEETY